MLLWEGGPWGDLNLVVSHAKKSCCPAVRAKRYSSSAFWLHLLMTDTSSVGAAVRNTHASNVAVAPGVSTSRSGASTLLLPLNARALPNLPAVLHVAPTNAAMFLFDEASAVAVPVPSFKT